MATIKKKSFIVCVIRNYLLHLIAEAYLESYKTSMMKIFARTDSSLTH